MIMVHALSDGEEECRQARWEGKFMLYRAVCWVMLAVFPISLWAGETSAAMLYAKGTTWVNGGIAPKSLAVFPGDFVQTKPNAVADINASGSNVIISSDSLVQFEGDAVAIEHGSVSVKTHTGLRTHTDDLTVLPSSNSWTEFEVANLDGRVSVIALKGDVSVSDGSGATTLSQGQQTTRDMSARKKKRRDAGAAPAGAGAAFDNPIVVAIGVGAIAGIAVWASLQSPNAASPAKP
jgi:hypothetical protein